MIKTEYGIIEIKKCGDDEIRMSFSDKYDADTCLCYLKTKQMNNLIEALLNIQKGIEEETKRLKEIAKNTNFDAIYDAMDKKYNPYPICITYERAFMYALEDGIIDKDVYDAARKHYGSIWDYVGD